MHFEEVASSSEAATDNENRGHHQYDNQIRVGIVTRGGGGALATLSSIGTILAVVLGGRFHRDPRDWEVNSLSGGHSLSGGDEVS